MFIIPQVIRQNITLVTGGMNMYWVIYQYMKMKD